MGGSEPTQCLSARRDDMSHSAHLDILPHHPSQLRIVDCGLGIVDSCGRALSLRGRRIGCAFAACVVVLFVGPSICAAQETRFVTDRADDVQIRRTDQGNDGPVDPDKHRPADILSYEIGVWEPKKPREDIFKGKWEEDGDFFRLDIVFDGLINPPGTPASPFDPFTYGDHPVFGYVEVDMDADEDVEESTGGEYDELHDPKGFAHLRFNGNVARYGGFPEGGRFENRIALDDSAFDGDFETPPFIDRSGEEFHIALVGWEIDHIEKRHCPGQCGPHFERGNTWVLFGQLFHRAHGYKPFSFGACCPVGEYMPEVQIQFDHNIGRDKTTVSIVYPLTNKGSAAIKGDPEVEPNDGKSWNQNSVLEALEELKLSAESKEPPFPPEFDIIKGWEDKKPTKFLDPLEWAVTVLVSTSYTEQQDALFVWTDHSPDVEAGDFNGDGEVDEDDAELCRDYIAENDGDPKIDCGGVNGEIELCRFAVNFSLFDVNYDGIVDESDCTCDEGCGLDLADFATFQLCFTGEGGGPIEPECEPMDFDRDDDVDLNDLDDFIAAFTGP